MIATPSVLAALKAIKGGHGLALTWTQLKRDDGAICTVPFFHPPSPEWFETQVNGFYWGTICRMTRIGRRMKVTVTFE